MKERNWIVFGRKTFSEKCDLCFSLELLSLKTKSAFNVHQVSTGCLTSLQDRKFSFAALASRIHQMNLFIDLSSCTPRPQRAQKVEKYHIFVSLPL